MAEQSPDKSQAELDSQRKIPSKKEEKFNQSRLEVIFAVVLFLFQVWWAMSGFPPNIVLSCLVYAIMLALFIHAFWIWKATSEYKFSTKIILIVIFIAVNVGILWMPVREQYRNEYSPKPSLAQRPVINISYGFLEAPLSSGKFPVAQLTMKNTGHAEAHNVTGVYTVKLLTKDESKKAEQGIKPQLTNHIYKPPTPHPLGEEETATFSTEPLPDPQGEFKKKQINGDFVFYVWVIITYSDSDGKKYTSEFCGYSKSVDSTEFMRCSHWNKSTINN